MGLFDKIFTKKEVPPAPVPHDKEAASARCVEVSVSTPQEATKQEAIGKLSHLDFGKPAGALGCYLNYEPRVLFEPSEKQLALLNELGVFVPDGITNKDASCMISRAIGEDDLESPGDELVALAAALGVQFSAFEGVRGLLGCIVQQAADRDRAALYIYAVRQNAAGSAIGNMLKDPAIALFYTFADRVVAEPSLLRSLKGRDIWDFIEPHHGTAIYKAATATLSGGGV